MPDDVRVPAGTRFPHRAVFKEGVVVKSAEDLTLFERIGRLGRIAGLTVRRAWWHARLTVSGLFSGRGESRETVSGTVIGTEPDERSRRGWIVATIAGAAGIVLLLLFLWHGHQPDTNAGEQLAGAKALASLGAAGDDAFLPPQTEPVAGQNEEPPDEINNNAAGPAVDDSWMVSSKPTPVVADEPMPTENDPPRERYKVFNPESSHEPKRTDADEFDFGFRRKPPAAAKANVEMATPRGIVSPEEPFIGAESSPVLTDEPTLPVADSKPEFEIAETEPVVTPAEPKREPVVAEDPPLTGWGKSRTRIVAPKEPLPVDERPIAAAEPQPLDDYIPWRRTTTPRSGTTRVVPAADPFDQPLEPMQPVSGTVPEVRNEAAQPEPARPAGEPRIDVVRSLPEGTRSGSALVTYEIKVRNRGTAALAELTVEERIPSGMSLAGSSPAGTVQGRAVRWEFTGLEPETEKTIKISLKSDRVPAEPALSVPEIHVRRELPPPAGTASLRLKMEAPSRLQNGQTGIVRFFVMNDGSAPARQVQISTDLPSHLSHPRGPALIQDLGTIAAGETRVVDLKVKAVGTGSSEQRATVTAAGNLKQQSAVKISVQDRATTMAGCPPTLR
jgi:uncharacterized repeat protein (TIGR01451 family)